MAEEKDSFTRYEEERGNEYKKAAHENAKEYEKDYDGKPKDE